MALTCLSAGLAGAAFGLYQYRENRAILRENRLLRQNRAQLIRLVKAKQRRIADLRERPVRSAPTENRTDSATHRERDALARRQIRSIPAVSRFESAPLSFDQGMTGTPLISITFDGGAHANAAASILDTLQSREVKTTMFLTGRFVQRFPDIVKRILAEGHELGNHTDSHPHLTTWNKNRRHHTLPRINAKIIASELRAADARLRAVTGTSFAAIWRAPYGEKNDQICRWALDAGYLHIGWRQARTWRLNLDSNDWIPDEDTPGYRSPEEVLDKIVTLAKTKPYGINGGIILMHLGTSRTNPRQQVHRSLGVLIDTLRTMNYHVAPISVLLNESGIDLKEIRTDPRLARTSQRGEYAQRADTIEIRRRN